MSEEEKTILGVMTGFDLLNIMKNIKETLINNLWKKIKK